VTAGSVAGGSSRPQPASNTGSASAATNERRDIAFISLSLYIAVYRHLAVVTAAMRQRRDAAP
jgi:hypothetical protein